MTTFAPTLSRGKSPECQSHEVRFWQRKPDKFLARCNCGWTAQSETLEMVQVLAASHDLDDIDFG
jgi:hypothetical protein